MLIFRQKSFQFYAPPPLENSATRITILYSAENFDAIHVLHQQEAEKSMREIEEEKSWTKRKEKKGKKPQYTNQDSLLCIT